MTEGVLVVGATSAIASALARELAAAGYNMHLASRDTEELKRLSADLGLRYGVEVGYTDFDIEDVDSHERLLDRAIETLGNFVGVVLAAGMLVDSQQMQNEETMAAKVLAVNFTAPALLLSRCARALESRGHGFIVGLGSVAGDRGRQSNYTYGAAKGGLALYLQGLRNRLAPSGIHVLTVKPGFVDTAMTYGLPGLFLVAMPQAVASDIMRGIRKRRNTLYTPWFWWLIMFVIKAIPEGLFKRMKL